MSRLLATARPSRAARLRVSGSVKRRPPVPTVPRQRERLLGTLATARVDLSGVHPSWWNPRVQEESPAVQRIVAASAPACQPGGTRRALARLPRYGRCAVDQSRGADWTLALWTERLVGGEPERPDDPPAIFVLSRLSPRAAYRLCHMMGIAIRVLAGQDQEHDSPARIRHWEWLQTRLASVNLRFRVQARVTCSRSLLPRWHGGIMRRGSAGNPRPAADRLRAVPRPLGPSTLAIPHHQARPFLDGFRLQAFGYRVAIGIADLESGLGTAHPGRTVGDRLAESGSLS